MIQRDLPAWRPRPRARWRRALSALSRRLSAKSGKGTASAVPPTVLNFLPCHSERSEESLHSAGSCIGPSRKNRAQDDKMIANGLYRSQIDGLFGGSAGKGRH